MEEERWVSALQGFEETTLEPVELLPRLLMAGLMGINLLLAHQDPGLGKRAMLCHTLLQNESRFQPVHLRAGGRTGLPTLLSLATFSVNVCGPLKQ